MSKQIGWSNESNLLHEISLKLQRLIGVTSNIPAPSGGGDVVGPASAVNENIAVFDGTTGKLIKDGLINKSALANTSGTNTGDQVGDGVTITGAGTVGDPFVSAGGGGTEYRFMKKSFL